MGNLEAPDDDLDRIFVRADHIQSKPIEWMWPGLIPRGAITDFEGDPGAAKSTLLADIAARATTGRQMPESEFAPVPSSVLWLGAEDDSAATNENLRIAGANLSRVKIYDKRSCEITLPDAASIIERAVAQTCAGLVVIDPFASFISGSPNSEAAVRKALGPLAAMAERTKAAVCIIRHLAKARGRSAMYAGAGSIGIVALARSAVLIGIEPGDHGRRVLAQFKSNAGPRSPALAFKIVDEAGGRRLEWLGTSEFTAEQLVNDHHVDVSAVDEAAKLLISVLKEGTAWVNDIKAVATRSGISATTLGRAKRMLKIESHRSGFGLNSRVYWVLPKRGVLIETLKQRELDELVGQLVNGDSGPPVEIPNELPPRREPRTNDDDDDADWWKQPA